MAYEHKEMSGSLFKNGYKKEGDNQPDYKGGCLINGVLMDMAAWIKETDKKVKYMQFKFSPPYKKTDPGAYVKPPPVPPSTPRKDDDEDSVPF